MDSFLFVGYRLDIVLQPGKPDAFGLKIKGIRMPFASESWLSWPCDDHDVKEDRFVILANFNKYHAHYWCPLGWNALIEQVVEHGSVDVPDDHYDLRDQIWSDSVVSKLVGIYGKENITLRWGIFLGWG